MLLGLFMWVWYICVSTYVFLVMIFFRAGRGIRIVLLLYSVIPVYEMITMAMRVIWDVYSVFLSYPYLRHYLC